MSYYKMHRGWTQHPVLAIEPYCRRSAWAWLIEAALWQDREVRVGTRKIELKRGQLSYSLAYLAAAWDWSKPKVQRFLAALQADAMADIQYEHGQSVLTLSNYDRYQDGDTAADTPTDTATDTNKKKDKKAKTRHTDDAADHEWMFFEVFWESYPKRKGGNPKKPARDKFIAAMREGVPATDIVAAVDAYARMVRRDGDWGSPYVAQAVTWLNQRRWEDDYSAPERPAAAPRNKGAGVWL